MVCSRAQFAVGHLWTGACTLGRGALALRRPGGVIPQVRVGIRVSSWGTLCTVRCGTSYRGQVNAASISDGIVAAVGHGDVGPRT